MSTIIRRSIRSAALVALVLGTWFLIMLVMPFVGPDGRQVAVLGNGTRAVRAVLESRGAIVEVRRGAIIARSSQPGFVLALYRNGAPLVIEGRIAAGCFPVAAQARGSNAGA
jgi:hypothetical protein